MLSLLNRTPAKHFLRQPRLAACRRAGLVLAAVWAAVLCSLSPWSGLAARDQGPVLRPDFPPWAPYPGLPLNRLELQAWNTVDHIELTAAAYSVYTNNANLRRVHDREDTYLRGRTRLMLYTAPGDPGFHFSFGGEASRIQFAKHDQWSGNEFAATLLLKAASDTFRFAVNYSGGQRLAPDEDHFSLMSRSYHEKREIHDAQGLLGIGGAWLGVMGESRVRAVDYPGLLGSRDDFIASENVARLGVGLDGSGAGVFTRDVFPMDTRFQQQRGRFDARPMQRQYDSVAELYVLGYFGNVHVLNSDNLGALLIDPVIALGWGLGVQGRYEDFFSIRAEGGPIRFELLGDNSTDHPGWSAAYWNLRAVIAPWDAVELHLQSQSGISEMRGAGYAQSVTTNIGLTWFINRNVDTGIDYSYMSMVSSRRALGRNGDWLVLHMAWGFAQSWATDMRIETRRRRSNGLHEQLDYNETRLVWGFVYAF